VLLTGALVGIASLLTAEPISKPISVYAEGKTITFTPAAGKHKRKLVVGDAVLGPLLQDRKPDDHRPNLYVVAPGSQYRAEVTGNDSIEFSLVLSELPRSESPLDWDVYWAVVLDPGLKAELVSETNLLTATQEGFVPGAAFSFDDIPSSGMLRAYLHIDSLSGLDKLRRADDTLPRLAIVPANLAVRASAVDPDAPRGCAPGEGRIARALSTLSHRCRKAGEATPAQAGSNAGQENVRRRETKTAASDKASNRALPKNR
jgi:hypothetical protein